MQHTPIKITFLGTGTSSGVPMIGCDCIVCTSSNILDNRLRSSLLIESPTTTIVIDTTPDFRYQMLRTNTKKLDAIVFTHPHKDHTGGLDDIRPYNFFSGQPMHIYANTITEKSLRKEYDYAFAEEKYPGIPNLIIHAINANESFTIGDITLEPILVWHLKMPVLGFKIQNFVYITDANRIDAAEKNKINNVDILVLNALRKEKHISHFTLAEAIQIGQELKAKQVYFTHISHQLGLHQTISQELPPHFHLAYDGLQLYL